MFSKVSVLDQELQFLASKYFKQCVISINFGSRTPVCRSKYFNKCFIVSTLDQEPKFVEVSVLTNVF